MAYKSKQPAAPPQVLRPTQRTDGKVEKYGRLWPVGALSVAVELQCYREAGTATQAKGNRGAEFHFREAWKLMWPNYEWSEWVDLLIQAWCNYKWIAVIGHQRASKSYTMAHAVWLDYCADPQNTLTSMGTVTLQGLRIRMWSDMQAAAETAAIKFPFKIQTTSNELRVYPFESAKESAEKFQIMGMALDKSENATGKIRGGHAPRRRLILDEAENISSPVYEAMVNPMSAPDAKALFLSNPMLKLSNLGKLCEPIDGWSSVSDTDLFWKLKKFPTNGICIHLDGRQSPNIKAKSRKFTGLLDQESINEIIAAHGKESVQYWSLVVGFPPPDGMVSNIFPSSVIEKGKKPIIFNYRPRPCASLDPAFEFDSSVLTIGEIGKRTDGVEVINATKTVTMKYAIGEDAEPKDYQCARQVIRLCRDELGMKPADFIMDRSGSGRGVYAILQQEWSSEVQGIEYSGSATERIMRHGGTMRACDTVEKFVTELWFRSRYYIEDGMLGGLSALHGNTVDDLSGRWYFLKERTEGSVMVAEKKVDYKVRLGRSCDWGDSFCGLGELLARMGINPGGTGKDKQASKNDRWAAHRERAKQLAGIYDDDRSFSI